MTSFLGEQSFEALMQKAQEGSEEAVWALLDRYSKNILRVVRRHLPTEVRSKVDSTDIVQSVWKSLFRKGACFDADATPEKIIAYLAGMARHKVYETHRHYTTMKAYDIRREMRLSGDGDAHSLDPDLIKDKSDGAPANLASLREQWAYAIQHAGERGRMIVELRLQGLTLSEIAQRMSISVSTVRRTLDSLLTTLGQ